MSISLIKQMISNKLNQEPITTDVERPFSHINNNLRTIRVGTAVNLQKAEASAIIAEAKGGIFRLPDDLTQTITAHGRFNVEGCTVHRFYLGDPSNDESPMFLNIIVDSGGSPVDGELRLYQFLTEINPSSIEEWDLWDPIKFDPKKDQIPLISQRTIKWQDQYEYYRMWGGEADYAEPLVTREEITTNGYREVVKKKSMLFGRTLFDNIYEYLLISVCQKGASERWVEAYVGIPITTAEITVY